MLTEGAYVAYPITLGIEVKESGVIQLAINLEHRQARRIVDGKVQDIDLTESKCKTAYFCLTKRDGNINTDILKGVKAALGWDGDLDTLPLCDFTKVPVVSIIRPKKDKPTVLEVAYINSIDWKPGGNLVPVSADGVGKISESVREAFRANLTEPKKPAPRLPPAPREPAPPKVQSIDDVYEQAWGEFTAVTPQLTDTDRQAKWIGLVSISRANNLNGIQFLEAAKTAGATSNDNEIPF